MVTFRKQEDCPASQILLSFQLGSLAAADARKVATHLRSCEFCAAEIDFYEHYPQNEEPVDTEPETQIPEPLYDLAESILNRGHGSLRIRSILSEIEHSAEKR